MRRENDMRHECDMRRGYGVRQEYDLTGPTFPAAIGCRPVRRALVLETLVLGVAMVVASPVQAQASPGNTATRAIQPQTALVAPGPQWWGAIRRDDVAQVRAQLLQHIDPNALNDLGNPALMQAAREQSWGAFDAILGAPGVQVDKPNTHDETALMYLAILGQTQRAMALIQAGAHINRLGWTPLHYAASRDQQDTARMLIGRGAIVNAPGPDGTTPLMMAAYSGKEDIVRLLLDNGADATAVNLDGESAADWALKNKHTKLAGQLTDLAKRVAQARASRGAPGSPAAGAPGQGSSEAAGARAGVADQVTGQTANKSAPTDDPASFSRYFDLGRFDGPAPGN